MPTRRWAHLLCALVLLAAGTLQATHVCSGHGKQALGRGNSAEGRCTLCLTTVSAAPALEVTAAEPLHSQAAEPARGEAEPASARPPLTPEGRAPPQA